MAFNYLKGTVWKSKKNSIENYVKLLGPQRCHIISGVLFLSLAPQPWATVSNFSYDSSVLQPSPSVQSIVLHEADASFETSFLHPSGSVLSVDRMSTIPGSLSPPTSAPSPLQPLTAAPPLPSHCRLTQALCSCISHL